jgi:ribonuclease P protein component
LPSHSFKKTQRLLNASDFKEVFDRNRVKVANPSLLILAKPTQVQHSRLGLVIAKKNIPTAVQRNRIKRVVRETFRQQTFSIPLDIVFLARLGAKSLSTKQLSDLLNQAWMKLETRSQPLSRQHA